MNWYEKIAKAHEEKHPETVAEIRHLFKSGNDIRTIAEYMDWSPWVIAELLEERLS
jgi:hypothetical protein